MDYEVVEALAKAHHDYRREKYTPRRPKWADLCDFTRETWTKAMAFALASNEAQAALTAAKSQDAEWQPIETAPKDGTSILAYGPLPGLNARENGWCGARETKWKCYPEGSPGYAKWKAGDGPIGIGWDWYESVHNWSQTWNPTHWQPLVAPDAHLSGETA